MGEPEPGSTNSKDRVGESRFPLFSVAFSITLLILLAGTLNVVSECKVWILHRSRPGCGSGHGCFDNSYHRNFNPEAKAVGLGSS